MLTLYKQTCFGNNYLHTLTFDQVFVNKTLEEGREVVYDLYDDVKEEVVEPLSPEVNSVMTTAARVMGQLSSIKDTVDEISKWEEQ